MEEDVGMYVNYKMDRELFRRSKAYDGQCKINECQFADNAVLLANTRYGAERAMQSYMDIASTFGLMVNIAKTKFVVTGHNVLDNDKTPIDLPQGSITSMDEFPYLMSICVHFTGRNLS